MVISTKQRRGYNQKE